MNATKMSFKNAHLIDDDTVCSCYCCCTNYKGSEITEFVDDGKTAICPVCGVDAVLPEKYTEEKLEELYKENFTARRSEYYKGD